MRVVMKEKKVVKLAVQLETLGQSTLGKQEAL